MKNSKRHEFARKGLTGLGGAAMGLLLANATPVMAQESAEADASLSLDEIVISARKRDETLHDVPLTMSAFSSEALQRAGVNNLEDIAMRTPGLQFSNQGVGNAGRLDTVIRFRGMDVNTEVPTQQLATVFIDGIPVTGGVGGIGLDDVQRVEVIKGPQSAFFGRSTFGGAINYVTRTPGDEFKGRITAKVATKGEYDMSGSWEGPLIPGKLAFRLGGRTYHTDGAYKSSADAGRLGEENTDAVELTLAATPTDNFDAKFRVMAYEDEDGAPINGFIGDNYRNCYAKNGGPLFTPPPGFTGVGPVDYFCGAVPQVGYPPLGSNTVLPARVRELFVDRNSPRFQPFFVDGLDLDHTGLRREAYRVSLAMNYRFGDSGITLSSLSGYNQEDVMRLNDFDKEVIDVWYLASARGFEDFSQEIRLTSSDEGRLTWLVGANYFDQHFQNYTWTYYRTTDFLTSSAIIDNKVVTTALFGALNYKFTDQWKLSLEGRYQEDDVDEGTLANGTELKKTFSNFLPRVILQYEPTENTNLYATYSEGNKPGDFNDRMFELNANERQQAFDQTGGTDFVEEEELENFELGWKQRFLDNRASLSLAGYYMKWKNQVTRVQAVIFNPAHPAANPVTGTRAIELLVSAGKTDLWGVELEGNARVAEGLDLGLTFAWAASEYKEFYCGFVVRFTGSADCAGNSSPRFPEFSGSVSANYSRPLNDEWNGFVRGEALYFGDAYIDESNLAWTEDYTTVNLRIGAETETLRLELWARNLLDDDYYTAGARASDFTNGFNFNQQGASVSSSIGRQVGLTATMRF